MTIELHSFDSPRREGYTAKDGDEIWVFHIQLDNGDRLRLNLGKESHEAFRSVILESEIDDAVEGALNNGASENEDKAIPG